MENGGDKRSTLQVKNEERTKNKKSPESKAIFLPLYSGDHFPNQQFCFVLRFLFFVFDLNVES